MSDRPVLNIFLLLVRDREKIHLTDILTETDHICSFWANTSIWMKLIFDFHTSLNIASQFLNWKCVENGYIQ